MTLDEATKKLLAAAVTWRDHTWTDSESSTPQEMDLSVAVDEYVDACRKLGVAL